MRVIILLSVIGVALAYPKKECGANSHYESCGTACPLTCDNYQNPPQVCIMMCNPGCHCDEGYVKDNDGNCVLPTQCPDQALSSTEKCGPNSHFNPCGTYCPLTCDNFQDPPRGCIKLCQSGCHCDEGYVKDSDGNCVRPEQCPSQAGKKTCGENSHYESCGTGCPLTCDNYDNPPKICVLMCKSGCHCDEGFVKDGSGNCVLPAQCPRLSAFRERNPWDPPPFVEEASQNEVCGENSHFNDCGSVCETTCDNYRDPPKFCVKMCKRGCFCDKGYVKAGSGRCILPTQCPIEAMSEECGANSHYESCGTKCPVTCENYENPPKICVQLCNPGCHCDAGYVKDKSGNCVLPEQCPKLSPYRERNPWDPPPFVKEASRNEECGENSHFKECGTACETTCDNHKNPPQICVKMCKRGCFCDEGYVKDNTGRCVLPTQCPNQAASKQCGANSHYNSCGTMCPLTCKNYNNPPEACILMCNPGCHCDEGYVKDGDRCVLPQQCDARTSSKQVCGKNERYNECGTACPLTCDNYQKLNICMAVCVSGCECEPGFVRGKDGSCVRKEQCP